MLKDISNYSTKDLIEELKNREGVEIYFAEPDSSIEIMKQALLQYW